MRSYQVEPILVKTLVSVYTSFTHTVYFNFNKTNAGYGDYNNMLGKAAAYGATVMGMAAAWIRKAIRAERDCVKTF